MKHFLLCVVLIAFAEAPTFGQEIFSNEPHSPKHVDNALGDFSFRGSTKRPANPFLVFDEKSQTNAPTSADQSFQWADAVKQSLIFLGVQHGYALTQPKTRRDLKGPFIKDYVSSVKSLRGWGDGGRFFTNYIAHPMQGSLLGFIQVQNDPKGRSLRFNQSGAYWRSRLKALAWSSAWSTQFEIGPVSQASIGNVGLHGKQTYVDLVITPTVGTAVLILEDFLDDKLIRRIENRSSNFYIKVGSRMLLNPTRSVANLLRFKAPWYRDQELRSNTPSRLIPTASSSRN